MSFPYSEKVMEHFKNPRNVGKIEDLDGKATEGSPACGDMVAVYINVNKDTQVIDDIKFESYGCASNIATGSIITEMAKGKTIEEAKKISWKEATNELGGLPSVKTHCSVLAVDGLRAAIRNYEEKQGIVAEKVPTDMDEVTKRLRKVMNPMSGLDIVKTSIVKDIKIDNGAITVELDIPDTHQFASNLKEEIHEKLDTIWDIDSVTVKFNE